MTKLDIGNSFLTIKRGKYVGLSGVKVFGRNTDIDSGADEDLWGGGGTWVAPTQARIHDIVSNDVTDSNHAYGTLTLTGNAGEGEVVVIDGKTYTFQGTLTDSDGNVHIGATASDSIDNLIAAITLGAGAGTDYATSTTLHPTVTASAGAGDTMIAEAKTAGNDGDSIATTTDLGNGSWGNGTLDLGVGARTVFIEGLDSDFDEITETVNLRGTTSVATSNSYIRINFMTVKSAGSDGDNAGVITATAQTDSTVTNQIDVGDNISLTTIYTVPNNRNGYITHIRFGELASAVADAELLTRRDGEVWIVEGGLSLAIGSPVTTEDYDIPIKVPEKTDIKLRVDSDSDNITFEGGYDLILENTSLPFA